MNKEICYVNKKKDTFYGYKKLKHILFDDKDQIKWNVLEQLFPFVETINIQSIQKTKNGFRYSKSILIDDALMTNILSYVTNINHRWRSVIVNYPSNETDSRNKMMNKYSWSFKKYKYKLSLQNMNHSGYGRCLAFRVDSDHPGGCITFFRYDSGHRQDGEATDTIQLEHEKTKENTDLRYKLDKTKYENWDANMILSWICKIKNGIFNQYKNTLLQKLNDNVIEGIDLSDINNHKQWKQYGITKFSHRTLLIENV
eukprot:510605_1